MRRRLPFLSIILMLLSLNVYSQSYILIGNDNNITGSPTPYEGYWHDARMQIIYSVSELTDAGLSSGSVITGLGFDIAAVASTQAYTGFTVKMAHTSTTSFGSTAWLTPSFTQVYSASYTVTATGWTMHGFSTNFTWNGTSNIVVEVCFDNTTYTGDDDVYYSTTTDPMVCYAYSDNDSGCSMAAEYTSTSRPNIIFRTAGSSTITTCSAVFFDSGGPSGTYANNENYTVTYTSSSGGCIRAIVENYDVEYDYDYLYIYDGTSTAGTLLDVLNGPSVVANLDDEGTSYYGLSGSLTFHFTSDVSNTYSGWEFTIDCPQNCYPPSCSNTVPANDNCTSSTMICDFNGYCGSTSGTVDHSEIDAANSAIFCGIIDNNTWLSFVASETEATLDVWVTDCPTAGSDGIGAVQLQVYETDCSTGNFTPVSNCWSPAKLVDGQIRATGLTPGNEYMIMVDGWNGAECNYSFAASSGVAAASAGLDQTLCEGQVVTFTASGGTVYSWASDPVDPSLSGQESSGTINVSPSSTTTYSVTVTGLNPECPGTAEAAAIVNAASATFTGLDASYCSDDASVSLLPDPTGGTITGSGISGTSFIPSSVTPGISIPVTYSYPYDVVTAYETDFSSTGAWSLGTGWSVGSAQYGCSTHPDPQYDASPSSDNGILGYLIGDCYENSITATRWATSPTINCSGLENVTLTFKRWLGVESSSFDHAYIEAFDGANWQTIWDHTGTSFQDGDWTFMEYDVSDYADNNSSFAVRFGMGITDGSVQYSGWNIDDLAVSGVEFDISGSCVSTDEQYTVVYPTPTPVISGATDVCAGQAGEVYSIPVVSGSTYQWSVTGGSISGSSTSSQVTINWGTGSSGTLTIEESSGAGCIGTQTINVSIHANPTANISPDPAETCVGINLAMDGNASGGSTPYNTHTWSNIGASYLSSTSSETPIFNSSTNGTFNLTYTVEDAYGCTATDNLTVTVYSNPAANISPASPATVCSLTDLQLQGNPTGGSGSYNHSWTGDSSPLSSVAISNPLFNASSQGTYNLTYTVTDGNTCTASDNITINVNPSPVANISPDPAVVCEGNDLLLNGTPSGGGGVFVSHNWTGNVGGLSSTTTVNPTFNSSTSGTYNLTYTVQDNAGCSASDDITVTVNPEDDASFSYSSATYCQTASDPTPTISGVGGGTFTATPSGLAIDASTGEIDLGSSTVGVTYDVTYTTTGTCSAISTVSITITSAPDAEFYYDDPFCEGSANVLPNHTTGSNGVYTSSAGLIFNNTNTGSIDLISSTPGTYTVLNTISATGCATATHEETIIIEASPTINMAPSPAEVCANADLQLDANVTAGDGIITTHNWTGSTGPLSATNIENPVFASSSTGTFNLGYTVTDDNGCSATESVTVTVYSNPSANITPNAPTVCEGSTVTLNSNYTTGDGAITSQAWTGDVSDLSDVSISNPDFVSSTSGTFNLVYTITDDNGCSATDDVQVLVNEGPSVAITPDPAVTCSGVSLNLNGNPAAGSGPISNHSWTGDFGPLSSTAVSNPVFNAGTAGTYNLTYTVTDNNGCSSSDNVAVTVNGNPSVAISPDPAKVCAGDDLILDGNPTGGSGTYSSHGWDGDIGPLSSILVQSPTFNTQLAGNYNLEYTVEDDLGCQATDLITVVVVNNPSVSISPDPAVVCAESNLSLSGNPIVGSALISTHQWSGDIGNVTTTNSSNTVFSAQNDGSYNLVYTVTDNNSCTASDTVLITVNPLPGVDIQAASEYICAESDLQLDGNPSSVVPFMSHAWAGNTVPLSADNISDPIFNADNAGLYNLTYTVTDSNSCSATDTIDIEVFELPQLAMFTDSANCGIPDGSAWVEVSGGASPYDYEWSNGVSNDTITNVGAAVYHVTVTDVNGCENHESVALSNIGAGTPTIVVVDSILCNGDASGILTATMDGGTAPYTYYWLDETGDTITVADTLTGIIAGDYGLAVEDAGGCIENTTVSISEPSLLTAVMKPTDVTCNGLSDGEAEITAGGGILPYSYEWSTSETTAIISNIPAGSYYVTLTDDYGCELVDSVEVEEPQGLVIDIIEVNDVACNGQANGSATANVSGGQPGYTYLWSDDSDYMTLTGAVADMYYITVTDDNGCSSVDSVEITEPEELTLTGDVTDASCAGDDGTATAQPIGGTSPYTYLWSAGAGAQTSQTASGLSGGNYTVTVTDANSCTAKVTVVIEDQPGGAASIIDVVNLTCYGANDGQMAVVMSGGTEPFEYMWSHDASETDSLITGLSAGDYYVTVTDANGCTAMSNASITQPASLQVVGISSNVSCYGMNNGQVVLSVSNGTPPYSYDWSGGTVGSSSQYSLSPGIYNVTISDDNGCSVTKTYNITEPDTLEVSITTTGIMCHGDSTAQATAQVFGGTEPYVYAWSANTGNQTTAIADQLYSSTINLTITDANGCLALGTTFIPPQPEMKVVDSLTYIYPTGCDESADGSILLGIEGGVPPYNYSWSNGVETSDSLLENLSSEIYRVTITDIHNCTMDTLFFVDATPMNCLQIPRALTPNDDGANDTWKIRYIDLYDQVEIEIFNRWGNEVYEFIGTGEDYSDPSNQFNGTDKAGRELPHGSYTFIIKLIRTDEEENDVITGTVTIIK